MSRTFWLALIAAFGLLSACQTTSGTGAALSGGTADAPGIDPAGRDFDPLLTGHRLMQAKEYELALKAYYRAASEQGTTAQILASIGTAQLGLRRLGQAEQMLRRAIDTDEKYVPAWNNLGVVLLDTGRAGEAVKVFETAFALDSGQTAEIGENLKLALANFNDPGYSEPEKAAYDLIWRGRGDYLLMSTE